MQAGNHFQDIHLLVLTGCHFYNGKFLFDKNHEGLLQIRIEDKVRNKAVIKPVLIVAIIFKN